MVESNWRVFHLSKFEISDLTTWKRDVAYLTGVSYGGVVPL